MNEVVADKNIMPDEELIKIRRTAAMRDLLALMIVQEDSNGIPMTQQRIADAMRLTEMETKALLSDMLEHSYVSRSVGDEHLEGDVMDQALSWGTTFFGRKWFNDARKATSDKKVDFFFPDHTT